VNDKEIKGLQAAGQYIHHDSKSVVMHEVKGTPLSHFVAAVPHDQRKAFVDHWKPKVAEHAALIAKTKGILHKYVSAVCFPPMHIDVGVVFDSDLNINNVK
jgi:glycerol-3-phosphate dehydrogenase